MDKTSEARIRDYERWVCEALNEPVEDPVAAPRAAGDNLVEFPVPGEIAPRSGDLQVAEAGPAVRRSPGTREG